ncbi:MAG: hypothetical protein LBV41_12705 [Cytophagaceae bacterium]|nr:hypothetical protein [Cytophagaceae bacterium]
MKPFFSLLFVALPYIVSAQNTELRGTYQGENLYVQNPFAALGVGFCVYEVTVNGMTTTDEINSNAFEVDLGVFGFYIGEQINVSVKCKEGCTAKVLNADVLKPRASFEIVSMKTERENLVWTTRQETGPLTFYVEQFRWNKWVTVGEIMGKGTPEQHSYTAPLRLNSGENRFRLRQTDSRKKNKYSKEIVMTSNVPPVSYSVEGNTQIVFTQPTMYEVYDSYGRIVFKGYSDILKIDSLEKGRYYLNFDNKLDQFTKK